MAAIADYQLGGAMLLHNCSHRALVSVFMFGLISLPTFGQSYQTDSVAVQIILDASPRSGSTVASVSGVTNGRIDTLHLEVQYLNTLPSAIGDLTELRWLSLANNSLTDLPAEFWNLTNLCYLDLSRNDLAASLSQIGSFSQLDSLDLSYNAFTGLPSGIGNLAALRYFDACGNALDSIPSTIGNLPELVELNLGRNDIAVIPAGIGGLTKVKKLILGENDITSVPPEIGSLAQVKTLSLKSNQISSLPAELGNLGQLTNLLLHWNVLTSLPSEIQNLDQLLSLQLANNSLTTLPPEIGSLPSLLFLYLEENNLSVLPSQIGNLTQLQFLYLMNNQLKDLPVEMTAMDSLRMVSVARNQLCEFVQEPIGNWLDRLDNDWYLTQNCASAFLVPVDTARATFGVFWSDTVKSVVPLPGTIQYQYPAGKGTADWLQFVGDSILAGTPNRAGIDSIPIVLSVDGAVYDTLILKIIVGVPGQITPRSAAPGNTGFAVHAIPARRQVEFLFPPQHGLSVELKVFDATGRLVWERNCVKSSSGMASWIFTDTDEPRDGVYFVTARSSGLSAIDRLVILK